MAKKPKEPGNNIVMNDDGESGSGSGSADIFKTLFGDIPEKQTSVSLFSDENPFRRKSIDRSQQPLKEKQKQLRLAPGSGLADVENNAGGDTENPNSANLKKRKKKREKKAGSDSDSVNEAVETKKLKEDEPRSCNLGVESKERFEGECASSRSDSKQLSGRGKGRKQDGAQIHLSSVEEGRGAESEKNKKKKRKRDELEAEYEARRYGVATLKDEGGEEGTGREAVGKKRKKVDDPADMMVSKEGFDDEAKLLRTVFVGNLPLKVKKKSLFKEFSQFGEVESVRIRSVPLVYTKLSRKGAVIQNRVNDAVDSVHAYVVFKAEHAAQASLAHNMAVIGGNHIRVDRACPPRKKMKGEDAPLYDHKRTVFIGNLPFDVKEEEVYQLFCGIKDLESSIEAIRVIRDPCTSLGKGIAYVLFKTRGAANLVVKKHLKLRDRGLRLCHARSEITPSKRKNASIAERNDSPAKKLAVDSTIPDSNKKVKLKVVASYQGLMASKSGVHKKGYLQNSGPRKLKSGSEKGEKPKEQKTKRPAVAARKAKTKAKAEGNALMGIGASKQAGQKRKLESQAPESACKNKRARKFR